MAEREITIIIRYQSCDETFTERFNVDNLCPDAYSALKQAIFKRKPNLKPNNIRSIYAVDRINQRFVLQNESDMSRFFAEATTYGDIIYVDLHGKTRVDLPGSIHDKIKCQTCRRPIGTFRGMHTQDDTLPVLCQRCEQKRKPKNLSKSAPVPTVPKDEIHVLVSTKPSSFTADMLTLDARVRAQRNAEAPSASGSEQVTTPEKKKTASPQKKHRRKSTTPEKFIRPISPTVTATPSSSGSQMATSQPTPSQSIADPIPEEPTLECEEILNYDDVD